MGSIPIISTSGKLPLPKFGGVQRYAELHTPMAESGHYSGYPTGGKLPLPKVEGVQRYAELYTPMARFGHYSGLLPAGSDCIHLSTECRVAPNFSSR